MKFNKDKCRVQYLEWTKHLPQYRLETCWKGSSFAEKGLCVLVDSKLNKVQEGMRSVS